MLLNLDLPIPPAGSDPKQGPGLAGFHDPLPRVVGCLAIGRSHAAVRRRGVVFWAGFGLEVYLYYICMYIYIYQPKCDANIDLDLSHELPTILHLFAMGANSGE